MMQRCWLSEPSDRPTFSDCKFLMKEHLMLVSPPLNERLERLLEEDRASMERYSEWRDADESDVDLRAQATRNGFIAVPTQEPHTNANIYMQHNG
ncbi:unnamed protein product [Gongylonema pulchrum]|uniref:Uncharacterized protein n=1 Tax=Gongylonema pulchrum TaxID=637853 RepID=A0A3P7PL49_9BILA|nr:unnamed protein product [Gongylonema pulchrum]